MKYIITVDGAKVDEIDPGKKLSPYAQKDVAIQFAKLHNISSAGVRVAPLVQSMR